MIARGARTAAASIRAFRDLLVVQSDSPELVQAQIQALSKQMPLLFFICFVNAVALAWSHYGVAPKLFTVGFPVVIAISYSVLSWTWLRTRYRPLIHAEACALLNRTAIEAPLATAASLAWAWILFEYGDAYTRSHVAFTVGITIVSCIFCQMHHRPAALAVCCVAAMAFAVSFLNSSGPVFLAIALSMLPVLAAMVYIVLIFYRDFASMIAFQHALGASHAENARLANVDNLTDLPNRRQFFSSLRERLGRTAEVPERFVVGVIDLDGFKLVNDLYGHAAGDRVLREAGRRMRDIGGEKVHFARLGGDEFAVIVDAPLDEAEIYAFGARICKVLEAPFELPDGVAEISGSVGFATFPEAGSTAEALFERADYSLYYAKQHKRGRPVIFSIEHETEIRQLAHWERCLREADLEAEMSLQFQPIFDVERGETVAFEALARWNNPRIGVVSPDIFIRVAERSDLINKLTRMLLRRALADAKNWPIEIHVSFNLSMRDLGSREAIMNIIAIIESSGVPPDRIDLEVTETALIQDFDQASSSLRVLKALGVGISLDDFGTGYSSLSYLQQFPIDKVKVDRSFIKDVDSKRSCRAIVKSVLDLCQNLELGCIVEGLETEAQVRVLRELGCTTMQGYFFGKPMAATAIPAFLEAGRSARALQVLARQKLAS